MIDAIVFRLPVTDGDGELHLLMADCRDGRRVLIDLDDSANHGLPEEDRVSHRQAIGTSFVDDELPVPTGGVTALDLCRHPMPFGGRVERQKNTQLAILLFQFLLREELRLRLPQFAFEILPLPPWLGGEAGPDIAANLRAETPDGDQRAHHCAPQPTPKAREAQ